jgi:hypothetical protein
MEDSSRNGLIIGSCVVGLGLSYFLTQRYHSKVFEQKRQERIRQEKRWSNPGQSHVLAQSDKQSRDGKDVKASFLTENDIKQGIGVPQPRCVD